MKENNTTTRIVQAEYRLLHCVLTHRECLDDARVTDGLFIHPSAKSIFNTICDLSKRGVAITKAELLQSCKDIGVTPSVIDTIFNVDDVNPSLDTILPDLLNEQLKTKLIQRLDLIKESINLNTDINTDDILKQLYECDDLVLHSTKNTSPLMSIEEWSNEYIEDLQQRKLGKKYTYGDLNLDEEMFKGAYPGAITTIAASTGSGKSTFVLNLMNNLIEQNTPCMYISLEMGAVDTMDRLIAMRKGIPNDELYNQGNIDSVIESVEEEKRNLLTRNKFYFVEDPSIDLTKLRSMIREFKQRTHEDYCLVAIDLLTQLKGFNVSTNKGTSNAMSIELAMNDLNALAKEENVHIIGVVQFRRDSDSIKISSLDDLERARPTLGEIKNSGAISERSRVVLGIFRPKMVAERFRQALTEPEQTALDNMSDIMEVQVLKNSAGNVGRIFKYMFDNQCFRLLPLVDETQAKINALAEVGIDF